MNNVVAGIYKDLVRQAKLSKSVKHQRAFAPPQQVELELTNICNLRCVMCDRWKWAREDEKAAKSFSTLELYRLSDQLAKNGVKSVKLTGGEPLIREDFCTIAEYMSHLGIELVVFTNGTLMNLPRARVLAKTNATVFFSIDGVSATHDNIRGVPGTFDKAMEGIRNLVKVRNETHSHSHIMINFTVQKCNANDIVPIFMLAEQLGVDTVSYNLVHGKPEVMPDEEDVLKLKESFETLKEKSKLLRVHFIISDLLYSMLEGAIPSDELKLGLPALTSFKREPVPCFVAYTFCVIDTFGRVFPCWASFLVNFSYTEFEEARNKFCMGNINQTDFGDIWYGAKYNEFRANTNPVDVNRFFFCGHCYDHQSFKKLQRSPMLTLIVQKSKMVLRYGLRARDIRNG
jgi:MoaA/NifB/PqqE/SkfB family radical SAM enzyme